MADKLQNWTIDLREKGVFDKKYVDNLAKELLLEGKKLTQIYVSDAQKEALTGVVEKPAAYNGIQITNEP